MTIPSNVQQLIASSGNSFHAKVARWFQSDGWYITVSPYYMDQAQNKAREIDLLAEKVWPIRDLFGRSIGDVHVRLFIECKFVPMPSVFWFADKDDKAAEELVCSGGNFRSNNQRTREHHYLSSSAKVAKVFASNSSKEQENEPFYKALNQALNAHVSMRGRPPTLPSLRRQAGRKLITLEFPVVVCSSFDPLYAVDFYGDADPKPIVSNFQLEVRYAYKDRAGTDKNDYFLLDFVAFSMLQEFAKAIEADADVAAHLSSS